MSGLHIYRVKRCVRLTRDGWLVALGAVGGAVVALVLGGGGGW